MGQCDVVVANASWPMLVMELRVTSLRLSEAEQRPQDLDLGLVMQMLNERQQEERTLQASKPVK